MTSTDIRRAERIPVSVGVDVETVLERHAGRITDLTQNGAQIVGKPFKVGEQVKLVANDEALWAKVRWAESDRMGVQFETPMPPQLAKLLETRRPINDRGVRTFGRRAV